METIKVLLVESSAETVDQIVGTISKVDILEFAGSTDDLNEAAYILKEYEPNVVLLSDDLKFDHNVLADHIQREHPQVALIMLTAKLKDDTVYNAIAAGANDVILKPFSSTALIDSIYRSNRLAKQNVNRNINDMENNSNKKAKGKIITLFSTKGGVGKTFLAANLAITLEKVNKKRVCLVDMDLDLGNIAQALDIVPKFSMTDISSDFENVDQAVIGSYLTQHESRIMVLPSRTSFSSRNLTTADHIETTLKSLSELFDYVIVDMPSRSNSATAATYRLSDMLLLVTTPQLAAISNVNLAINSLLELNIPESRIKVILNQNNSNKFIKPADVERAIARPLFLQVVSNRYVSRSLNEGNPIVMSRPRNKVSKTIIIHESNKTEVK